MIRRALRSLNDAAWHPTDEQLLAHIDAELDPREAQRVTRHVEGCWACRARRQSLESTITAFMEAYTASLDLDELEDDGGLDARRLSRAAADVMQSRSTSTVANLAPAFTLARTPFFRSPSTWFARLRLLPTRFAPPGFAASNLVPSRFAVVRLVAVCATAMLVVLLSSGPPLSARQLVRQVERAERSALDAARTPVVYQRLEVAQRLLPAGPVVSGTWEVWTDVASRRWRSEPTPPASGIRRPGVRFSGSASVPAPASTGGIESTAGINTIANNVRVRSDRQASADTPAARHAHVAAAPAHDLPATLHAVFDRHGMRSAWPISMRGYAQWRAQAADVEDTVISGVTSTGDPAVRLVSAVDDDAASGIVRATLIVRERDWHAVEQRLVVRENGALSEFVVREAAFDVLPRASLPVAFFDADLPPDAPAELPRALPRSVARVSLADLVTAEVEAMYALHRLGLSAEDEITVSRGVQIVEVSGLTTTDDRRGRLVKALAVIPHVRTWIRTAEEALAALDAASRRANVETSPLPLRMDDVQLEANRLPAQALMDAGADARAAEAGASASDATLAQTRPVDARKPAADPALMGRARDAVRQSLALLERAWALRRLAEWTHRTEATHVTAATREMIDVMAREHVEAAAKALAALDLAAAPALPTLTAADRDAATDPRPDGVTRSWSAIATDFFGLAAEIDRDTRQLFTASSNATSVADAPATARRLKRGLDRAAREIDALQHERP